MKLHLGCGDIHKEGYINIDSIKLPAVDIVRDVLRGIPFSNEKIDEIYSENFLEHIPQQEVIWIMNEMWRVMKIGGRIQHIIPLANTTNFNQDPTHLAHWNFETITYFTKGHRRNIYYHGFIKGWKVIVCDYHPENKELMNLILEKC